MVLRWRNRVGGRTLTAVVTLADGQALLDLLSEEIDRLDQDELRASATLHLRRLLVRCLLRPARDRDLSRPMGCGCEEGRGGVNRAGRGRTASGNRPGGRADVTTAVRAFADRLRAADGAELATVIREFGRWADAQAA